MTQIQQLTVCKLILQFLAECGSHMLPEPTLHIQLNILSSIPVTLAELQAELKHLEADGFILGIRGELPGSPIKWKITDPGKAVLACA
jgi:hypothetical protein